MSIKYKDKLISALSDQIDNKAPDNNKVYSSAYIEALNNLITEKINNLGPVKSSVKGVVGTKADLDTYDTTKLQNRDIIYVLADESHDDYTAYWRWNENTNAFDYIGSLAPYYTPTEIDAFINAKQDKLVSGVNIKTINGQSILGEGNLNVGYYLDILYPVGSIYITVDDNFDPSTAFGGTWAQIENGRFLIGSGDGYQVTNTGGASTVSLGTTSLPAHTHTTVPHTHTITADGVSTRITATITEQAYAVPVIRSVTSKNNDGEYDDIQVGTSNWALSTKPDTDWLPTKNTATVNISASTPTLQNTGGTTAHNNLPPYYTVHYWYRTA